ncbi:MAG: HEAT repeat domain-containing protein, partial [Deltaproteobacteria bacterium]|nr:HEAT repeat domain-containing protein [Deltaproteobacteria bacterium]
RVRVAAVRALGPHRSAEDAVVRRLAADRWPLVRAAALEALARPEAGPAARSAIVRAVEDRSWSVRVSAIRALGPTGVRDADARVLARLRDARETSEVRRAAVELIESRCWRSARAALLAVLRERPETLSDEWVSLGVSAWRALHRLGPSSELREAEGFGRGLPADLQREVRRARPCVPRESRT